MSDKTSQQNLWSWGGEDAAEVAPRLRGTRGALVVSDIPRDRQVDPDDVYRLHRRLESHLGVVDLIFTNNRRRMVTARRRRNRQELRLHHMFIDCDDHTVAALVGLARGDDTSRGPIRDFIRDNREVIQVRPSAGELSTRGDHHDLAQLMRSAKALLDEEELDDVVITWGRNSRGRRSIRFGSYDFDQRLIRIHPALDVPWVPAYFVEFVIYHELLHALVPPTQTASRRSLHPPEFRAREAQFPRFEEAIAWEKANLKRLLQR